MEPQNLGNSFTSFTNRFFYFSEPPDFRMAFDAAEKNEKFGCIQCQKSKERKGKEASIPLQKDSERQSHPSELSKN